MVQNSKQKAHRGCSCDSCKRGAGTAFGQLIHNANERKLRRVNNKVLRDILKTPLTPSGENLVDSFLQEILTLEDADVLAKLNSPYTD